MGALEINAPTKWSGILPLRRLSSPDQENKELLFSGPLDLASQWRPAQHVLKTVSHVASRIFSLELLARHI